MTTAIIAITALAVVAAAVGGLIWATRAALRAKDGALEDRARTADTLFDLATAHGEIERAEFELKATTAALQAEKERTAALERSLIDAIETDDLGAGLADDDVRGRVLRIVEASRARAGNEVPAEPAAAVSDVPAAEVAGAG